MHLQMMKASAHKSHKGSLEGRNISDNGLGFRTMRDVKLIEAKEHLNKASESCGRDWIRIG